MKTSRDVLDPIGEGLHTAVQLATEVRYPKDTDERVEVDDGSEGPVRLASLQSNLKR